MDGAILYSRLSHCVADELQLRIYNAYQIETLPYPIRVEKRIGKVRHTVYSIYM